MAEVGLETVEGLVVAEVAVKAAVDWVEAVKAVVDWVEAVKAAVDWVEAVAGSEAEVTEAAGWAEVSGLLLGSEVAGWEALGLAAASAAAGSAEATQHSRVPQRALVSFPRQSRRSAPRCEAMPPS